MDALSRAAVVLDTGAGVIKAGLAGEDRPTVAFASVIGQPKHRRVMAGGALEGDTFVGRRAQEHRGALVLHHVIEHGRVVDWDGLTRLWQHVYDASEGVAVRPEEQPILLSESPFTPRSQRERAAGILFDTLRAPAVHFGSEPALALYGSGRTTGLVLDVGDGLTRVTPIYEGFALVHATQRLEYGGRDVTDALTQSLRRAGTPLHTSAEVEAVRALKETACYVHWTQRRRRRAPESAATVSRSSGCRMARCSGWGRSGSGRASCCSAPAWWGWSSQAWRRRCPPACSRRTSHCARRCCRPSCWQGASLLPQASGPGCCAICAAQRPEMPSSSCTRRRSEKSYRGWAAPSSRRSQRSRRFVCVRARGMSTAQAPCTARVRWRI